ncbi:hypothetical protein [Dyella sp. C11]|uniref:hypothetical protein n=1 Tax=Dyella sp. C11 TaxID=2126991 RepID=UPI0013007C25|nr:hypothetical protein [Dyella sp. C11]
MASLVMVAPLAWVGSQSMEGPLYVDTAAPNVSHLAMHGAMLDTTPAAMVIAREGRTVREAFFAPRNQPHMATMEAAPLSVARVEPLEKIDGARALADFRSSGIEPYQLAVADPH